MKINAMIVDDEAKLRRVLEIKLNKYCPQINVLASVEGAAEAYDITQEQEPQLVFLDISMPRETGFEFLERFDKIPFEVIFVTGFNNYVLNALRVSAVDYLLKPVVTEDLITAVKKAEARINERQQLEMIDLLKHNVKYAGDQESKIAIPGTNSYDFVNIKDIIRCEGWQKYTKIFCRGGETYISSYNIGVFKEMLIPYGFYIIHKSHLVNISHIAKYHMDGTLVMSDESVAPVSRRRRDAFMNEVIKQDSPGLAV